MARRDARVGLEWGLGLGRSETRELAVTHRGMTWRVGPPWRPPPAVGSAHVTRCGGASKPIRHFEPAETATTW